MQLHVVMLALDLFRGTHNRLPRSGLESLDCPAVQTGATDFLCFIAMKMMHQRWCSWLTKQSNNMEYRYLV